MSDTIHVDSVRGKVDFAVITIRPDEYMAVLHRISNRKVVTGGCWCYEYATIETIKNEPINIAIARASGQGHGPAQQVANDMMQDLEPKWLVLVGIAGAFPNDDFSLGDIVLASRFVDFAVGAAIDGGTTEYATGGGPVHPDVQKLLSWIPGQESTLGNWNTVSELRLEKPVFELPASKSDPRIYGDRQHKVEVFKSIRRHFEKTRTPCVRDACLATSNTLIKDTAIVAQFKKVARHIEFVEMEAGGVYFVSHRHTIPLLCVRGISDVVGFKRGSEWTEFACQTAASFFISAIKNLPLAVWGPSLSPREVSVTKGPVADATDAAPTLAELRKEMLRISDWLLRYDLTDDERIHLGAEDALYQLDVKQNVSLLLGKPGSGKTCLLARIGNKFKNDGFAVFAIKADLFPHNKSIDNWAFDELGCQRTFFDLVQTVSAREPVIVLIDQLDALANTVDLTSSRLNELLAFIARCSELPNVHIISSCRNFDYSYDPRFRRLAPRTYALDLPTWEQVSEKLQRAGISSVQIQPKLKDLLRTPQHLSMFVRLKRASGAKTFETYSEMLGAFWNATVTATEEIAFVNQLTEKLVETESIWTPMAAIAFDEKTVSKLCSNGLLERKNNQLRFSHQTIQEYAVARLFAESNVSLSDFVLKHQDTIFKRPTVWAVLNYLRDNTVEKYSMEVDRILENKPRSHVKSLLVDFMCRQPNPTEHEISTIGGLLRDDELALRILIGINNSPAWFKAFKQSHLPSIMSDPRTEQWPVVAVLSSAWRFEWDSTLRLVKEHWAKHHEFDGMTLRVLEHCGNWTEDVVSLIERIATRVKQNDGHNYRIEGIVTVMSVDAPKDAARLAARLISTPTTKQPESKNRHNSPLEQRKGWYDLEEVAKAAPVDFLSEITPWLVSTAEEYHSGYAGSVLAHYAGSCSALDDREYPREAPILTAIRTCVQIVSKEHPAAFVNLFRRQWRSENAVVHRIFIDGLMNVVDECTDEAFEYLMSDDRRFTVGENSDTQGSQSTKLIRLLFPCLNEEQRERLTAKIMQWSQYRPGVDPGELQNDWDRESRLHLLTAIPEEYQSKTLTEFIEKEKLELPSWDRERSGSHGGQVTTIPPMTKSEMVYASDAELAKAFSKTKPAERAWVRVEGGFEEEGGGEAAGAELSKLAETNPKRASEILRMLVANGLTTNITHALRGFSAIKDREIVFSLLRDVSNACDESEEFRAIASEILRSHCDDDGLPEDIIVLLESWLAKTWDTTRSVEVESDKKEWRPEQSLLWTNPGSIFVDTDNSYYTLIALTQALLSKNRPQGDRWMAILSSHLDKEVSYKTWRMFCDSVRFVRAPYCSKEMGKALTTKLFEKFPQLASETLGCRLLAMLVRFLDPKFVQPVFKRLAESKDQFDQQAAGELITLCALLEETMEWASPLLERYLFPIKAEETPAPAFLAGVAHAASNLWGDLNKPSECSKIIVQVISFGDSDAINAIRQLFWNEIPLPADEQTSAILQKLTMRMEVVSAELAGDVLGQLTDILPHLRPEILAFAQRFVETRFEELRRREFNPYEVGPYLVEIAMTLQRFVDTRSDGLNLFESLLRAGLDEANKALQDVDAVNEVDPQSPGRPSLRRRKRKE